MFRTFLFVFFLCCWATAMADTLPPQPPDLTQRFQNNPGAFDRYDQWCDGRQVNQDCQIPGSAIEGGGAGQCQRVIPPGALQIDLLCVLKLQPTIVRGLPDHPWRADDSMCEQAKISPATAEVLTSNKWTCGELPKVADQFCTGLQARQRCTLAFSLEGKALSQVGVCTPELETGSGYYMGRRILRRTSLLCQPAHRAPATVLKPVSAWRKLRQ